MKSRSIITVITLTFTLIFSGIQSGAIEPVNTSEQMPSPDEFIEVEVYPEMVYQAALEYPLEAKNEGVAGKVWVKALVDKQGSVQKAIVSKSSGSELLDQAALKAAVKNMFKPAIQNSKPVAVWVTYPVEFTLNNNEGDAPDHSDKSVDKTEYPQLTADKLVPVQIMPEMIYEETPEYPRLARQAKITGTVWVHALIGEDGNVLKANVSKSSGTVSLDEAAVKAAFKNKFKPAIQGGHVVKTWVTYPVKFSLDSK